MNKTNQNIIYIIVGIILILIFGKNMGLFASAYVPMHTESFSSEDPSYPASAAAKGDGDWRESSTNDVDGTYEWYITFDMTDLAESEGYIYAVNVHTNTVLEGYPCSIGIVKVCDDPACSGESNLLSSKKTFPIVNSDQYWGAVIPYAQERYIYMSGGIIDNGVCVDKVSNKRMVGYQSTLISYVQETKYKCTTEGTCVQYNFGTYTESTCNNECVAPIQTQHQDYSFTPSTNTFSLNPGESKTISVTLEHLDKTIDGSLYDISFDITGIIGEEGLKKNYLYQVEK